MVEKVKKSWFQYLLESMDSAQFAVEYMMNDELHDEYFILLWSVGRQVTIKTIFSFIHWVQSFCLKL